MKRRPFRRGWVQLALIVLIALASPAIARAQATGVAGQVLNGLTGQPVPGAVVSVEGQEGSEVNVDLTGTYRLHLPPGTYVLQVRRDGFATERITGVKVEAGALANVAVVLTPAADAADAAEGSEGAATFAEGITVEATAAESSEQALLVERKQAAQISDSIGTEEISKTTGSDAAGVLKRVTGISLQEDRFVYVRGLGDRYSNTTLNGSKIPSTEFEKKVVPLNLFPTGLLDRISVSKSYTVDKPGDFAAGFVDLRTLEFPDRQSLSLGLSAGYNTATTGDRYFEYQDGLDFFGDGGQGKPSSVPDEPIFPATPRNPDGFTRADIERFGEALEGAWTPGASGNAPYDQEYKLSYGNTVGRLGMVISASHENDYQTRLEQQNVYSLSGGELVPINTFDLSVSEETVRQSLLGNFSFRWSDNSHVKLRTLYTDLSNAEGRFQEGFFDDFNSNLRDTRVSYLNQNILNAQLSGEHFLPGAFRSGSLFEWRASATEATTEENRREAIYRQRSDGDYFLTDFGQSGFMYFNDLKDTVTDGGADWTSFLGGGHVHGSLKVGAAYTHNERDFDGRRLRFRHLNTSLVDLRLTPDELFTDENIGPVFELQEITRPTDTYDGDHEVTAAYTQADFAWGRWRLITGVRFEDSTIEVRTANRADPTAPQDLTTVDDSDVLPAINLVYQLSGDTNLRFAASQTVNRPEFRELAPFSFVHVVGGFEVTGNPDLVSATIRSYDVRWEWFPRGGEVVAASVFYKDFDDPIESVQLAAAQQFHTFTNAQGARNYGAEVELRRNLASMGGTLGHALEDFTAVLNYTYVDSQIEIDPKQTALALTNPTHPLTGQPDQVGNLMLAWNHSEWGTGVHLLVNHVGDKLYAGGTLGVPDVFEAGRTSVDLVWNQELAFLTHGLSVKLSGSNLTDEKREWTQGGEIFRAYDPGRTYGLSLTYEPF